MPKLTSQIVVHQCDLLAQIIATDISHYVRPDLKRKVAEGVITAVREMWSVDFLEDKSDLSTMAQTEIIEEMVKTALAAARQIIRDARKNSKFKPTR